MSKMEPTHAYLSCVCTGVVVKPVGEFKTAGAYQYKTIRTNVDILKLIQLGLTFCNGQGELPVYSNERCVWQFNFREFDLDKDMYAPESIKLLVDSGIDFKANVARGVDQARFAELLMTSGVVLNSDVMWITFHSGYDFGYDSVKPHCSTGFYLLFCPLHRGGCQRHQYVHDGYHHF